MVKSTHCSSKGSKHFLSSTLLNSPPSVTQPQVLRHPLLASSGTATCMWQAHIYTHKYKQNVKTKETMREIHTRPKGTLVSMHICDSLKSPGMWSI